MTNDDTDRKIAALRKVDKQLEAILAALARIEGVNPASEDEIDDVVLQTFQIVRAASITLNSRLIPILNKKVAHSQQCIREKDVLIEITKADAAFHRFEEERILEDMKQQHDAAGAVPGLFWAE